MNNTREEAYELGRKVHFFVNGVLACGRESADLTTMDVREVNCNRCMNTSAFGESCDIVAYLEARAKEEDDS